MAIYWIDPYMDATVGGIHGTTDTVSRTGTYAAPWSWFDFTSTSSTQQANTPAGVAWSDGDEVRMKGLSLSSFYQTLGNTTNLLDVDSFAGTSAIPHVDFGSANLTYLNAARSAYTSHDAAQLSLQVIYFDDAVFGAGNFLMASTDDAGAVSDTAETFLEFDNQDQPFFTYVYARGGTATTGCKMAFFDPSYMLDASSLSTSTTYVFNLPRDLDVTFNSGWTSSTVQDGQTLVVNNRGAQNVGPSTTDWFSQGLHTSSTSTTGWNVRLKWDCERLHYQNTSRGGYANGSNYFYINGFVEADANNSFMHWGGFHSNTDGLSYIYNYSGLRDANATSVAKPITKFNFFSGRYLASVGATSPTDIALADRATIAIDNIIVAQWISSSSGARHILTFGNVIVGSSGYIIGNSEINSGGMIKFVGPSILVNATTSSSFIYIWDYSTKDGQIIHDASATLQTDTTPFMPLNPLVVTNRTVVGSRRRLTNQKGVLPIVQPLTAPTSPWDNLALYTSTDIYGPTSQILFRSLDTGGLNWRTSPMNNIVGYGFFTDGIVFTNNSYDQKPIGAMATSMYSGSNSAVFLMEKMSNGDLKVYGNSAWDDGSNVATYRFPLYPDFNGTGSNGTSGAYRLQVSFDVAENSSYGTLIENVGASNYKLTSNIGPFSGDSPSTFTAQYSASGSSVTHTLDVYITPDGPYISADGNGNRIHSLAERLQLTLSIDNAGTSDWLNDDAEVTISNYSVTITPYTIP